MIPAASRGQNSAVRPHSASGRWSGLVLVFGHVQIEVYMSFYTMDTNLIMTRVAVAGVSSER